MTSSSASSRSKTQVLYDGACAFCCKSVELLRKLDWNHRLQYVDLRHLDEAALNELQLHAADALDQMHVCTPGGKGILHGFDGIRSLAWLLPPLWPIAPFLYLPGVLSLGRRAYLWVARNRFRLIPCHGGVCAIERKGPANS